MSEEDDKAERLRQARERATWGLLRALSARQPGQPLTDLCDLWEITAKTMRAESADFADECDTLEHCARELRVWLDAGST